MDWMNELSGVLEQYTGAAAAPARTNVQDDFDQIARAAHGRVADGLAAHFARKTPPSVNGRQLFSNSRVRSAVFQHAHQPAGPMILSQVLSSNGQNAAGFIQVIDCTMANRPRFTRQDEKIPAEAVEEIEAQAEKKTLPYDHVSNSMRASDVGETLGEAALTIALSQIANAKRVAKSA